jgi:hypothetical protein
MKRIVLFITIMAVFFSVAGCGADKKAENIRKFSQLAVLLPHQIVFENEYLQVKGVNGPSNAVVNTVVTVEIEKVQPFIEQLVCVVPDSVSAADLLRFKEIGFEGLGLCRDSTMVADSLRLEYQTWIVAASLLAYQAVNKCKFFTGFGLDGVIDDGVPASLQKITDLEYTDTNEFGQVTLSKKLDYANAPQHTTIMSF